MSYSEWFDHDLVVRIQVKSPPTIFSLVFLGFGGNLSQLLFVNIPSIILRPGKCNNMISCRVGYSMVNGEQNFVLFLLFCQLSSIT